ncbi:MAG: carbohydrate porin [Gallionella sp.]|nr:carbohydrate porin [Gallionella sp.]
MFRLSPLVGALLAATSVSAIAADVGGLEVMGYTRGGVFNGTPRGGYSLGGDMQKFRLGNEGDNGFELELRKTFDAGNGMKWSMDYMPTVWNGSHYTNQAYAEMTGLDFAPSAKFWAGQRRLRIQDVHIVDHFFLDYGLNYGAGMTDYNLGFAKLGVGVFNGGSLDNQNSAQNNARRVNVDLSDIQSNAGGVLRVLGTVVSGNFQFGSPGSMLSVSHNQSDFLVKGLTNTLFLQTASGHANLQGQFQGLGDATAVTRLNNGVKLLDQQPGVKSNRIGDSINWQSGKFGGQALAVIQNGKVEGGVNDGINTKDTTLGGRISYALTNNFKMLVEAGMTSRKPDNSANQTLNKVTIAPTLSLGSDFWSRPELRFYVTQASWNDAASIANAGFGVAGRTSSITTGAQIEVWW